MATENLNPSAQNELLGTVAEDVQVETTTSEVVSPLESEALMPETNNVLIDDEAQAVEESFAGKSREELVELMARMLESEPVQSLRRTVEAVKVAFYKLHRTELETKRKAFEEANEGAEFVAEEEPLELRFKELLKVYRQKRDEYIAGVESQKEMNLKVKLQIIEELKQLVESDETLSHTFPKFRELQSRWKETGGVPAQDVKDLWERYHLHTEHFYDFIKINKELRDLDLKKNLEQKSALCEQAEELASMSSVVEAFRRLQKLHDSWRETGPVANEFKEEIWARFKEASSKVNKMHQEYFEQVKGEQTKNLEIKEALCVKAEEMIEKGCTSHKEWNKASEKLLELQKEWKSVGFAPKKDNNKIYDRFRVACDRFFEAKRQFYASQKSEMEQNLLLKTQICERAEELAQSEDWKATTDQIIALQAQWKEIGVVSQRHSDQVWKRFRAACDGFFEKKSLHFSSQDSEQEVNLRAKEALLVEMSEVDIVAAGGFDAIKAFQRRWSELGFVPIKQKDAIAKRYKEVVDGLFSTLRGKERDRSMNRFKDKISTMKGGGDNRVRGERERLSNKVKQLEGEIALLENNIGFFSRSKGAEALIADVNRKIEKARREMADTIAKVKLIDKAE